VGAPNTYAGSSVPSHDCARRRLSSAMMSAFSELPVPHFRSNNGLEGVPSRPPADSAGPHRDTPDDWLDDALEVGSRTVRRLRISHVWPVRTFRAASRATVAFGHRVWSR